ncbi:MAG: UDP-N-acetylmuramoyl-L-alanyl-D-glutamate--2,6-diaminopimelate ligase [Pseudomonadota bacterium]|mgnify:CR=1 FL=1
MTRLGALVDGLEGGDAAVEVTGVAIDHRQIVPGALFGAFRGARFNAEDVIANVVTAGAVAVIARPEARVEGAVHIRADEPRRVFAMAAARFFGRAPQTLVAVTGTNGKTSTVELTRQLWRLTGLVSASIGTLGVTTADEQVKTGLTTPDIVTFLSNLSGLACEGVTHLAFEASSHGLDQYRTEGPHIAAGAFTNLSRDHLDYHHDMKSYFAAKMRLFDEVVADDGAAVIWTDDAWSDRATAHARKRGLRLFTIGSCGADIRLISRIATPLGQALHLDVTGVGERLVNLPLIGAYQAANALVAAGLAIATGSDALRVLDALARLQPVRGRLERAGLTRTGAPIYVDYAHTPDALTAALSALRPHAKGRLILVFGAGGDRDAGKRPEMGKASVQGAEIVIITDDNPRGEDASLIRRAIMAAAPRAREIADRRQAIAAAIAAAQEGDIIIIAGKGHEQGQIIGCGDEMRIIPFDDAEVARQEAGL